MSDCKRCDNCGKVFDRDGQQGLHVSRITASGGYFISTYGQRDSWDVCSWECLKSLAKESQKAQAVVSVPYAQHVAGGKVRIGEL